jgi:hypothetical protein
LQHQVEEQSTARVNIPQPLWFPPNEKVMRSRLMIVPTSGFSLANFIQFRHWPIIKVNFQWLLRNFWFWESSSDL